ncbi:MAG: class I SAM-dependent methyltransferase [Minisyncoccia bacterium]
MVGTSPALSFYLGDKGRTYQTERLAVPEEMYLRVAALRAQKFLPHVTPKDKVLEFGVGLGHNLAALPCRRVGYDVDASLRGCILRRRIGFRCDTSGIRSQSFDVVICHHVLEHVTDPWVSLREMRRLLRPGGTLLLFVPYEIERTYQKYDPNEPNHHLYSWNPQTLGALASQVEFRVENIGIQHFGYDRFAAVAAARIRMPTAYRSIRKLLLMIRPRYEICAVLRA